MAVMAILLAIASPARAATVSYNTTLGSGATLALFDSSLGTLDSVLLSVDLNATVSLSVLNSGTTTQDFRVIDTATVQLSGPSSASFLGQYKIHFIAAPGETFEMGSSIIKDSVLLTSPNIVDFIGTGDFGVFIASSVFGIGVLPTGITAIGGVTLVAPFAGSVNVDYNYTTVAAIPLPASLPLFLSGLVGLGIVGRRRRQRRAS